ncbi:hypothetical protein D3C74_490830 [compost metagenome]
MSMLNKYESGRLFHDLKERVFKRRDGDTQALRHIKAALAQKMAEIDAVPLAEYLGRIHT